MCREVGQLLSVEDLAIADPEQGEVRVKLAACAICHSDIMFIDGHWEGALPAVYGHEAAGIVESIGSGVSHISVGDHVVVTLIRSCGDCHYCARSIETQCENRSRSTSTAHYQIAREPPLGKGSMPGPLPSMSLWNRVRYVLSRGSFR